LIELSAGSRAERGGLRLLDLVNKQRVASGLQPKGATRTIVRLKVEAARPVQSSACSGEIACAALPLAPDAPIHLESPQSTPAMLDDLIAQTAEATLPGWLSFQIVSLRKMAHQGSRIAAKRRKALE
jgi:hypothetical protein